MKIHILQNDSPTSLDIMDSFLGYDVPLMPGGIVISTHPVDVRVDIKKRAELVRIETFDDCLNSLHHCRPYIINPGAIGEEISRWLTQDMGAESSQVIFSGREHKVYVEFGARFIEQKKFLMFLNERQVDMRYLKFVESGGEVRIEPLEELCLLAFLS